MSKRNWWVLALLGIALLAVGACITTTPQAEPLTPITIQLGWTHQAQFAGLYAAVQQGFFAEEGLDVTFVPGGSGIDILAPVLAGTAQFGVMSADELILARAAGKPVKAIATVYQRSPVTFISLAAKNIKTPQDFVG
jgi:NitT/TauT family transport system substrate-binding protein